MTEIEQAMESIEESIRQNRKIIGCPTLYSAAKTAQYGVAAATKRNKALDLALTALREKAERKMGCEYCTRIVYGQSTQAGLQGSGLFRFCPMCGRALTGGASC